MNNEHPDMEQLQSYLHGTDDPQHAGLRMHLLGCATCRKQIDTLGTLLAHQSSLTGPDTLDDEQHRLIMAYVDDQLDDDSRMSVQRLLDSEPQAMRAALHYAGHSHTLSQPQLGDHTERHIPTRKTTESGLSHWFSKLLDYRTPLWASIPATAFMLTAIAFITLQYRPALLENTQIAMYQDDPVLQFRSNDILPGIGFFSQAGRTNQAYGNVHVDLTDDSDTALSVVISWPVIAHATRYDIKLSSFDSGDKKILGTTTTDQNNATFSLDRSTGNQRYEWVLSGETSDNRTFYTSGGFVINIPDG